MYLCTDCNEISASEYLDRYDDEIYIKCSICGRLRKIPACTLCGDRFREGDKAFRIEKDIYCTGCVESITV